MFQQLNPLAASQEEEEVDDEDMGVAETYADYMPTKCEYYFLSHISAWCLISGIVFSVTCPWSESHQNGHRHASSTCPWICEWMAVQAMYFGGFGSRW